MQKLRSFFVTICLLVTGFSALAQDTAAKVSEAAQSSGSRTNVASQPEMADVMLANGKIYVVVVVLATIFAGIIGFLVFLERKISRLEKNNLHP
jgi:hypothetical protein